MRVAAFVLLGAVCLDRLQLDLLPKVSTPVVVVSTSWPNVSPEELETEVTRPVEQAVSSAPNIYNVTSSTSQGSSRVSIQFNWGTDIGQAAVDVLQLVERAKQNFPKDSTLGNPVVFKFDPSTTPILSYGVSGIKDSVKLRSLLDNEISPMLQAADGVASVNITGGDQRAIIVNVDPRKMQAYGVSLSDVSKRLDQENVNLPAGIAKQGNTEFTIRSVGDISSPKDAERIPLGVFSGHLVSLGDVATVSDSHQETRVYTRLNGEPCVGVSIVKQSDANTISTADAVRKVVATVNRMYPELKFRVSYDQSSFISNSIDDLKTSAVIGGAMAIIILMFFLRSVRSTIVVALSIPTSIISTFSLLYFCGFTLNTISLSGLALATGLIVDDAVVVLENIFRHVQRDGKSPREAAVSGTSEISSAVVASTLTVMIVFLPLVLIKGQAGQVFTQFALVVIFSLAISLLDSTTAVPMLASRIMGTQEILEEDHPELRTHKTSLLVKAFDWFGARFSALDAAYRRGLELALKHRWQVLIVAFGISGASLLLKPLIGSEMMPQTDSGDINLDIRLPIGTALSKTNETMKKVERILMDDPDIATVFAASGANVGIRGANASGSSNRGSAVVKLLDDRKRQTQDVIKDLQKKLQVIPGIRSSVQSTDLVTNILTGGNTNMEVDIVGQNLDVLTKTSQEVMATLKNIPGLENVDVNIQDANPEIQWKADRQKAQSMGVSFDDIASALNASTNGDLAGYYKEHGFQYPIYVQMAEGDRKSLDQLLRIPVTPGTKLPGALSTGQVLLSQVATPTYGTGPNQISRLNRQRYIAVSGRTQGRSDGEVQEDVKAAMDKQVLPAGTYWDFGVNQKRKAEEFAGMGLAVLLAIGLIYMLLASQFESFIHPLVVLTSVPLCTVGVILAMFLSGRAFGLTAYIGILMLVGIVVKNGILLVDYTNRLRLRGLTRDEAILRAGPTRLRPILMTTSAAILGMFPLALALGRGSETQAPLATAVIGGLTTSTALTLFVVPIVYTLFDDLAQHMRLRKQERQNGGGAARMDTESNEVDTLE
jgi:HAE1 family hydrophobic/amphiphilic exporter-1